MQICIAQAWNNQRIAMEISARNSLKGNVKAFVAGAIL